MCVCACVLLCDCASVFSSRCMCCTVGKAHSDSHTHTHSERVEYRKFSHILHFVPNNLKNICATFLYSLLLQMLRFDWQPNPKKTEP